MFQNNGNLIVFSQWDFVGGPKVKRRDYRLDQIAMINGQEPEEENNAWVPAPVAEYPLINYWEVRNDYYMIPKNKNRHTKLKRGDIC